MLLRLLGWIIRKLNARARIDHAGGGSAYHDDDRTYGRDDQR